jgi:hypothetical protein
MTKEMPFPLALWIEEAVPEEFPSVYVLKITAAFADGIAVKAITRPRTKMESLDFISKGIKSIMYRYIMRKQIFFHSDYPALSEEPFSPSLLAISRFANRASHPQKSPPL